MRRIACTRNVSQQGTSSDRCWPRWRPCHRPACSLWRARRPRRQQRTAGVDQRWRAGHRQPDQWDHHPGWPSRRRRAEFPAWHSVWMAHCSAPRSLVAVFRLHRDRSTSTSNLIRIDPNTGALISSVPIIDGTTPLFIADLAVHPTTGVLYGTGGAGRHRDREGYRVRSGLHHQHDNAAPRRLSVTPPCSSQASPLHPTERCTCQRPTLAMTTDRPTRSPNAGSVQRHDPDQSPPTPIYYHSLAVRPVGRCDLRR